VETLRYQYGPVRGALGQRRQALVGVVASGNLEILLERCLAADQCQVEVATSLNGFGPIWSAVIADFVTRGRTGGLRISINDAGARPDTVTLRLAQGLRVLEGS
jgi:malonate decarboxylase delta subunit